MTDEDMETLTNQIYNNLLNGQDIDLLPAPWDTPANSLKHTFDLMSWYDLYDEFQLLINRVFNGELKAIGFKRSTSMLLAVEMAKEIKESSKEDL